MITTNQYHDKYCENKRIYPDITPLDCNCLKSLIFIEKIEYVPLKKGLIGLCKLPKTLFYKLKSLIKK